MAVTHIPKSRYLNTRQASEYLGMSESWLRALRKAGDPPIGHRFGTSWKYLTQDLDDWARSRRDEPEAEAEKPKAEVQDKDAA